MQTGIEFETIISPQHTVFALTQLVEQRDCKIVQLRKKIVEAQRLLKILNANPKWIEDLGKEEGS